jgi:hypothetical protein
MTTRSRTGSIKPKTFPNYILHYCTKHPLKALSVVFPEIEPTRFNQANLAPEWHLAVQQEYEALIKNGTWTLCPKPPH